MHEISDKRADISGQGGYIGGHPSLKSSISLKTTCFSYLFLGNNAPLQFFFSFLSHTPPKGGRPWAMACRRLQPRSAKSEQVLSQFLCLRNPGRDSLDTVLWGLSQCCNQGVGSA